MKSSKPNSLLTSTACGGVLVLLAQTGHAQSVTGTPTLPDAKPGECYAMLITPAKFTTRTEEVIVQAASERVETVPARYENAEQTVIVKEASREIKVTPAEFEDAVERVEIRPAENNWTTRVGNKTIPASPGSLDGIARSGIALDDVEPGTCFREYYTPAEYRTDSRQVLTRESSVEISVSPAEFETIEERVTVKEASSRVVDVPAVYRTETQSVLVEPARSVWQNECGPMERVDKSLAGATMCLVEVPARYETITKTVLDKPASTKTITVPAVYKTVKAQRLVKPASEIRTNVPAEFETVETRTKIADAGFFWLTKGETPNGDTSYSGREVCLVEREAEFVSVQKQVVKSPADTSVSNIAAEYQTLKIQRLVSAATERRIPVPARVKTVNRQVQTSPSSLEWRQILCEANMTPKLVTDLQRALKREGFDPGPIDGYIGRATLGAVEKYQIKKELDRGGLTFETLKELGVSS